MSITANELFNFIQGSDITGASSYDIWKSLNPNGTETEFLEYLSSSTDMSNTELASEVDGDSLDIDTRWLNRRNDETGADERFYPITHVDAIVGLDSAEIGSNNDLVDTELSETITGEEPNMDIVIQNTINEKTNAVQANLDTHIADVENPHNVSPEQIGALPLTGGTLSGNVRVEKTSYPYVVLKDTTTGSVTQVGNYGNTATLENRNVDGESDYRRLIYVHNSAQSESIETALQLRDVSGGTSTQYNIYGAHNKSYIRDYLYPVGSVVCMSSNTNPSTKYGGTWTLIDKEYKCQRVTATTTLSSATSATVYAYLSGHTIDLYVSYKTSTALTDDSITLATITPSSCGATQFGNATRYYTGFTDVGNVVIAYGFTTAGVLSTRDVLVRGSSTASVTPSDSINNFQMIVTQNSISYMVDSFCDKFYFQRTA